MTPEKLVRARKFRVGRSGFTVAGACQDVGRGNQKNLFSTRDPIFLKMRSLPSASLIPRTREPTTPYEVFPRLIVDGPSGKRGEGRGGVSYVVLNGGALGGEGGTKESTEVRV